jgi:hypothetical protein
MELMSTRKKHEKELTKFIRKDIIKQTQKLTIPAGKMKETEFLIISDT